MRPLRWRRAVREDARRREIAAALARERLRRKVPPREQAPPKGEGPSTRYRFSEDLWSQIEDAARNREVSPRVAIAEAVNVWWLVSGMLGNGSSFKVVVDGRTYSVELPPRSAVKAE